MSHPTTTWAAIVAAQVAAIEALTPDVEAAGSTFRRHAKGSPADRARMGVRDWALNGNLATSFRVFDIVLRGEGFAGAATQYDVEEYEAQAQLVVCYPLGRDKFDDDNDLDLSSVIAADFAQLRRTIGTGGKASYPDAPDSGQVACWFSGARKDGPHAIEERAGCWFGVSALTVLYFRSPAS